MKDTILYYGIYLYYISNIALETMLKFSSLRQTTLKANMTSVITDTDDMEAQNTLWMHESKSAVIVRRKFRSKYPRCRNNILLRKVIRT